MARPTLRDVHTDGPMTQISIAYHNADYIAEQVFPVVNVTKKSDTFFVFDKDDWFRNVASLRAPGNRANRMDYKLTTASYNCLNYALAKGVPDEVRANADAPLSGDIEAARFTTNGLLLALEIRVADLVSTCGNWANASNPGTKWNVDTSDPFSDIDNLTDAVSGTIGRAPNVATMSWPVWQALRRHPDFIDRVKHTRAGGRVVATDFMEWFGFEKVLVGHPIKNTALEGETAVISRIWGDMLWAGYVPAAAALMEPAAGYVLEWQGRQVEVFREDQEKQDVFSAEHWTDERITASDAGGIYSDVI